MKRRETLEISRVEPQMVIEHEAALVHHQALEVKTLANHCENGVCAVTWKPVKAAAA